MDIKRRDFLKQSALGIGAVIAGPRLAGAAEPAPAFFDPYEKVTLGRTGLQFPRLCLGTGANGWHRESNHTRMGQAKFTQLVRGAHDRGVRLFDSADLYGTHPFLASALDGVPRDQYSIVTKIWWAPDGILEKERPDADVVVARFLKELRTDHIELVLLHCVTSPEWPQQLRRQMEALATLKQKGVVRAVGVSCHSLQALEAAAAEPWVDSVHTRINPYGMSMDGSVAHVLPVIQKLHAAGKGVVGMKLVGNGQLRHDPTRLDESVRYALQSGVVEVLNVGCESTAEVDDFAARVRKVRRNSA
jgi:aryl-alcohol dehydrogenase-like predicted oxidoreductase